MGKTGGAAKARNNAKAAAEARWSRKAQKKKEAGE
jgi:hypothetical protein